MGGAERREALTTIMPRIRNMHGGVQLFPRGSESSPRCRLSPADGRRQANGMEGASCDRADRWAPRLIIPVASSHPLCSSVCLLVPPATRLEGAHGRRRRWRCWWFGASEIPQGNICRLRSFVSRHGTARHVSLPRDEPAEQARIASLPGN